MKVWFPFLFVLFVTAQLTGQIHGKVKVDRRLSVISIDSTDWVYPLFTIKRDGVFRSTCSEKITRKDTIHLVRNSKCFHTYGYGREVRLPFCKAKVVDDTLIIQIYDECISNDEWLIFKVKNNNFTCVYEHRYDPIGGQKSSAITSALILSKVNAKPGKWLEGEVDVEVEVKRETNDEYEYVDRGKIRGYFKVKIE